MNRTLLWDAGPGEIRAGLVEDGKLTEFRIIRPWRTEWPVAVGEQYTARILENLGDGKALVSLGGAIEALLEHAPRVPEGTLLAVEMVRPPIPEPGRWKRALVRARSDVAGRKSEGCHQSGKQPWESFLLEWHDKVDRISCSDAFAVKQVFQYIGPHGLLAKPDPEAIENADFDSLIEAAAKGEFAIEGGMLSIERTRAMTTIDIDGGKDPVALNLAAASEIPRLLRLLDIGGQVGIDFLSMPDRKSRQLVDSALAGACDTLGPHERTAMNGFGFVQIVRPRSRPSIPEIVCETTPGRISVSSRAVALLRAAARSCGHGKRQLVAAPPIIEHLRNWPDELEMLRASLGAEIELVPDSSINGYGYVHVSHN